MRLKKNYPQAQQDQQQQQPAGSQFYQPTAPFRLYPLNVFIRILLFYFD